MKKNAPISRIDDYLQGMLTGVELTEFENRIEQSEELAEDVRFQKEVFEAIKDERKREISKTLNRIHLQETTKLRKTQRKDTRVLRINFHSWRLQAAAAAIAILLVSGGLISNFLSNKPVKQSLYTEYFSPENSLLSVRSAESVDSHIKEGMHYYEQGKFTEAISIFEVEPDNLLGKLYAGFSFMKLEKYEQAEARFLDIINDNDNLLVDQAEWNLGLCYLANGKTREAGKVFAKIADGNTIYNKDANTILQKMKE
ncbi:MAG: hypothetical protein L3J31_01135 [Bacteroidales bacterium]|nr:hypothetical protein [Bacteroidales bacterium]MCF6341393.1 hypothetical protein [Bacteroidales bacterium]